MIRSLFADLDPGLSQALRILPGIACSVILFGGMFWIVLTMLRRFRGKAETAQVSGLKDVVTFNESAPGLVHVVFHTYYGFLVFFTQTEYNFWATPDDARKMLWNLHKFNLKWSWFAYGGPLVPLLSYLNYLAQKRSIQKQAASKPVQRTG